LRRSVRARALILTGAPVKTEHSSPDELASALAVYRNHYMCIINWIN